MDRHSHAAIQELLASYALDAVSESEAEDIELHLRDCPLCRAEITDHRQAARVLAMKPKEQKE